MTILKYYDKDTETFHIKKMIDNEVYEDLQYKSFINFAKKLEYNFDGVNLFDYDFNGIDLKKYNIDKAGISSEILKKQGLFDESFYTENVALYNKYNKVIEKNLVPIINRNENDLTESDIIHNELKYCTISYISDIHLDNKIYSAFPYNVGKSEIRYFIKDIVNKMCQNLTTDYLVIAGDVSHSFEVSKIFYEELILKISSNKIIVILGNHEIWGKNIDSKEETLDSIVNRYKLFFKEVGIKFLHNGVLLITPKGYLLLNGNDLYNYDKVSFENIIRISYLIFVGGTGFSGYNEKFNAENGIYRETLKDINEDREQSNIFYKLYKDATKWFSKNNVIVVTHNPMHDWADIENYNKDWIYINGHTHSNYYYCNEYRVYGDNQIGYNNDNYSLKNFITSISFDYFETVCDGIHKISDIDYQMFNLGKRIKVKFNRKDGEIYLLKRNKIYAFFYKTQKGLYFLNGGAVRKLNKNKELEYYYDKLPIISKNILMLISDFDKKIKKVSCFVKELGGTGRIHGCIVDINYFNHLYINPIDGKITPYFAYDIVDKYVYNSLRSLLKARLPQLMPNYYKLLDGNYERKELLLLTEKEMENDVEVYYDTSIYMYSRKIKQMQYLSNNNVLREWNDNLIDENNKELNSFKNIFKFLLE